MKLSEMNGNQLGDMATEVRKSLAAESKREAKGVSWDLHQRECDRNEALEYEIETLKAKVADLENVNKSLDTDHKWLLSILDNIKSNTVLEALKHCCNVEDMSNSELRMKGRIEKYADELNKKYTDKLEAGTL